MTSDIVQQSPDEVNITLLANLYTLLFTFANPTYAKDENGKEVEHAGDARRIKINNEYIFLLKN